MSKVAIFKAFEEMPDSRRKQGTRHSLQLCLALFTLAVAAVNQGFLAIGDWLKYHHQELKDLFHVEGIPSYSAIRRVLLQVDYLDYAGTLANFFWCEARSRRNH
ncbi:transposase family protein [Okeania sp.]|uniref:transposase family protein n=1 Tax=Okeania sp. TaxID=3100323 RepID=UPI002B4ACC51|nr:transposase family protein [Okeania sp.]MEB3340363.1 transposase family protein [Okeania sp.]